MKKEVEALVATLNDRKDGWVKAKEQLAETIKEITDLSDPRQFEEIEAILSLYKSYKSGLQILKRFWRLFADVDLS